MLELKSKQIVIVFLVIVAIIIISSFIKMIKDYNSRAKIKKYFSESKKRQKIV
jgi:hypothetical protein